jgi:threonine synthase
VFATGLQCLRCGAAADLSPETYLCPVCGPGDNPADAGILDVQYDYEQARGRLFSGRALADQETADLFRFLPLLPVEARGPVLPVGSTPLYEAQRLAGSGGLATVYLKDETRNPTRALKDRATAIGVTRAQALGYQDVSCASSGNAAISLAGFSAFAGLRAHAFVPNGASKLRLKWLERFGAEVRRSEGDYDAAFEEAEQMRARGWYSRNCAFNPFLVEGKKTAGLEIAEQLDWDVPDLVICPVGDACTLGAIGKAFHELVEMGITDRLPRLIGVQSEAVQPVVARLREERGEQPLPQDPSLRTAAASIDVKFPRNMRRLLNEIERSDGTVIAVDEDSIAAGQRQLAEQAGVVAEFTSAATLAGLLRLAELESLDGRRAVLVVTGGRPDEG